MDPADRGGSAGQQPEVLDERSIDQLSLLPEFASVIALDGTLLWTASRGAALLGLVPEEMIGTPAYEMLHEDDNHLAEMAIAIGLVRPDGFIPVPLRFRHADGHFVIFETWARMGEMRRVDGSMTPVIIATSRDVHVRVELEAIMRSIAAGDDAADTLERIVEAASPPRTGWMSALVTAAPVPLGRRAPADAPEAPALQYCNGQVPAALMDPVLYGEEVPPWEQAAATGEPVVVASLDDLPTAARAVAAAAGYEAAFALPVPDPGSNRPAVLMVWADLAVSIGALPYWLGSQVTPVLGIALEQRRSRAELEWAARYDSLTGLPNRAHLFSTLDRSLRRCRAGEWVGVLYVDLDRFKPVNDTLGHAAGDAVLAEVAARFADAVRPHDLVGRLGGDEFAVVCPNCTTAEDVRHVGERIVRVLDEPVMVGGASAAVGASVGAVLAGQGASAGEVLNRADVALYEAKRNGGGVVVASD